MGELNLLVNIEGLFEADQVRIVSSLVRFGLGCRQFDANDGLGIGHVCNRFTAGLMGYCL